MGMCLLLRTLSDRSIDRVLASPQLIWRVVLPEDPEALADFVEAPKPRGLPRLCLTDPQDVDPRGIPAGRVGFNSLYRGGYSFVSPPCHPGAARIFGPGDPSDRA